jgi:hypothetical protein
MLRVTVSNGRTGKTFLINIHDLAGLSGWPKYLHSRTGRDETKRKTQEKMERRSGKKSSSVGSEKMERVGDR